jgi:DNA recombination protein RmuC
MTQLHQKLQKDFEILTNKLLEQSTQKLSEQNLQIISTTISPIKEYLQQVKEIEKRIQTYYDNENKERSSLKTIIEELTKRSDEVKNTADRLAKALTTEVKKQGNWGEFILEKILELSGLEKDREYTLQTKLDDKTPDVIIHLPDNKHLIIDSKVTLNALIEFHSAQSEEEKNLYAKKIIDSVLSHINNLSSKDYEKILNLYSVDFVLMFIPIESIVSIIQQYQSEDIFSYAIRKKIIIVTPTSLIATLKTIYFIWQQEKRRKDIENILIEIEKLYDKLRTFTDYFAELEKALQQAQRKFNDAKSSLIDGRGSAMSILVNKIQPYINPKKKHY